MPVTIPDGFPYEAAGDEPLHSLTGGQSGTEPILAEVVQEKWTELQGTTLPGIQDELDQTVQLLATIDAAGLTLATAVLTVPSGFRHLLVQWHGNHNGSGRVSLMARFNGDTGSNYGRSGVHTDNSGSQAWVFESMETGTGAVRVGYVGSGLRSGGHFYVHGVAAGFAHPTVEGSSQFNGSNQARARGEAWGSWSGTPPITSIAVGPLSGAWTNGRLSLYGYR